ncbi:hypothetical protein [Geminocystis herdmanii]|uniref:hypothetical protein n=1 Tax=Geminocystis herdmanii TaxID=669359 RepID=UPI00034C3035|nr:hypothetical protein [Geminocystis herdmanii]
MNLKIVSTIIFSLSIQPFITLPSYAEDIKSSCVREASRRLMNSQALEICQNANQYTASCVTEASRRLMNSEVVEVCRKANQYTASCVTETSRRLMNSQVVEVCRNSNQDTASCVTEASRRLSNEDSVKLCRSNNSIPRDNPRDEFANCIKKYINEGLSETTAVKICDRDCHK